MKTLLVHIYNNFEFLYLNPMYRITDSFTDGNATVNATLRFTGPQLSLWFSNDRGVVFCSVAPTKFTSQANWFRIPIVRQYLDSLEESTAMSARDSALWVGDNFARIEGLFTDECVTRSCEELRSLEGISAARRFGPA